MSREQDAPYTRGESQFNGGTIPATLVSGDASPGGNLWGKTYRFEDLLYGTGLYVECTVVNNSGTYNLKPGQLVKYSVTNLDYWGNAILYGQAVNALAAAAGDYAFPVDEHGPSAGFPPGDSFYIVTKGPCLVPVVLTGSAISIGGIVAAAAGSTTGDGAEGTVVAQLLSGATTALANQIQNRVGRAMSSCASTTTATSIVVAIGY